MDSKHLQPDSELRIVLLGKTGVGKSASGNTILGSEEFKSELSPSSVTVKCEKKTREFDGQTVAIVDTPGLFNTRKTPEEVRQEILDCITWLIPGPHAFLLVLKPDAFSKRDKKMLNDFQNVFKDSTEHTIVLFNHADEDQVKAFIESHKDLREFIESCEAYHVFNSEVKDESQVTSLLQKINKIKKERSHYSNEMFEEGLKAFNQMEIKLASGGEGKGEWISKILNLIKEKLNISEIAKVTGLDVKDLEGGWKYLDSYRKFVINWVYKQMPSEAS